MSELKDIDEKVSQIRSCLSSFTSASEVNRVNNKEGKEEKQKSKLRPLSRCEFESRLSTFLSVPWTIQEISPSWLAQFGWVLLEREIVQCKTCKALLSIKLPPKKSTEAYETFVGILNDQVIEAHADWCGWRYNPVPVDYALPPVTLFLQHLKNLTNDCLTFAAFGDRLPDIAIHELLDMLGIREKDLGILLNEKKTLSIDQQTAVLLVLTGWSPKSAITFRCDLCLRTVGLWSFTSIADRSSSSVENIMPCAHTEIAEIGSSLAGTEAVVDNSVADRDPDNPDPEVVAAGDTQLPQECRTSAHSASHLSTVNSTKNLIGSFNSESVMITEVKNMQRSELDFTKENCKASSDGSGQNEFSAKSVREVAGTSSDPQEARNEKGLTAKEMQDMALADVHQTVVSHCVSAEVAFEQDTGDTGIASFKENGIVVTDKVHVTDESENTMDKSGAETSELTGKVNGKDQDKETDRQSPSAAEGGNPEPLTNGVNKNVDCHKRKRLSPLSDTMKDTSMMTDTLCKRPRLIEECSPLKKTRFHPLQEHRHWCGWVSKVANVHGEMSEGYLIIPSHLKELRPTVACPSISSTDYGTNVEGLRAIRSQLTEWYVENDDNAEAAAV